MADLVNHPPHYNKAIEVIDFIEAYELCYHLGNVVKYVARARIKNPHKELEDLRKARWYLDRKIQNLEDASLNTEKEMQNLDEYWNCPVHKGRTQAECTECFLDSPVTKGLI